MSDHIDDDSEPEIEVRSEADTAVVPSLIPFPGKPNLDGNIATNLKKFKRTWPNYEIASGLSGKDTKLRTATLLTCVGTEAMKMIKRTLQKSCRNLRHFASGKQTNL